MTTVIPHSRPSAGPQEARALAKVIASGQLAAGPMVSALERDLSARVGHSFGAALSSGTAALYLTLKAMGIKKGDGVVIPSYVCTALMNAVEALGARVLLCDVDSDTGLMTPALTKKAFKARTRAVIVPHLFGFCAPALEIESLGVPVIEDCAQCVGATCNGKIVGGQTVASVFSFYATKLLGAGEGGMVASSDRRLIANIRDQREYDNCNTYVPRFNYKLSDLHAAVALEQLKKLALFTAKRRTLAARYTQALSNGNTVTPPAVSDSANPVFFRYVVRVDKGFDNVKKQLSRQGISASRPVYRPLHRYLGKKGFRGTDEFFRRALSIPLYPALTSAEVTRILHALKNV